MKRMIAGLVAAALWLPLLFLPLDRAWATWAAMLAVLFAILVAAPLATRFRALVDLWSCVVMGLVIGFVATLAVAFSVPGAADLAPAVLFTVASSALVFYGIGVWRNPYFGEAGTDR